MLKNKHPSRAVIRSVIHAVIRGWVFLPFLAGCAAEAGLYAPPPIATICSEPLNATVENSCIVNQHVLWRGARPTSEAAAKLVELGVKSVVSLELLHDDKTAFADAKPEIADQREIRYFQIRDWEPYVVVAPWLVDQHVAQFIAIMRSQTQPVYVHCRSGQNRTGIMVAAYQIFQGAEIESTITAMQKYGGFWARPIAHYLRTLTPERRAALEPEIQKRLAELKTAATIACRNGACAVQDTL